MRLASLLFLLLSLIKLIRAKQQQQEQQQQELGQWVDASNPNVQLAYFPYEWCVLQLAPDEYDLTKTIFAQPKCVHLLNEDNQLKNVDKRCWLGAKQQRLDEMIYLYL